MRQLVKRLREPDNIEHHVSELWLNPINDKRRSTMMPCCTLKGHLLHAERASFTRRKDTNGQRIVAQRVMCTSPGVCGTSFRWATF